MTQKPARRAANHIYSMRYLIITLFTLVACFAAQALALRSCGGRFTKNESNFFSSLGRIQAGAQKGVEVAFLGSSLTGRLPDRSHGFKGVANMGCDGGSAIDALRAMDRGLLPVAPVLVIETNTMIRAIDPKPSMIANALERPWFQIGRNVSFLSAYSRPSGFFYSILLAGKIGSFDSGDAPDLRVTSKPQPVSEPPRDWDDAKEKLITEIAGISTRLRKRGSTTVFIWLPPGRPEGQAPPAWMVAMAARSGSPWWDVGQDADRTLVAVTDGAHMAAPSAARTVRTVLDGLRRAEPPEEIKETHDSGRE